MKKILVTEDDKFLANAFRAKLTKAGFEIKIVEDGEEAMKTLETFTPDLILLDLVMPIKDGYEVLKELKAKPKWRTIPVLIATNLGQKEDLDKAMELGANGYIVKSDLTLDDLVRRINSLLKVRSTKKDSLVKK